MSPNHLPPYHNSSTRLKIFAVEQWTPSRVWDLKDLFEALYENTRNGHPLKELKLFNDMSAELDWGSDEIPTVISTRGLRFLRVRLHDLTQTSVFLHALESWWR